MPKSTPGNWMGQTMSLEFESINHGKIAFGLFNTETDRILLNQYCLFSKDFCYDIVQDAEENN